MKNPKIDINPPKEKGKKKQNGNDGNLSHPCQPHTNQIETLNLPT